MRIILPNTTIFHYKALHRMKNQSGITSIFIQSFLHVSFLV